MRQFPFITDYVNEMFRREKERWDYHLVRPVLIFAYFFVRCLTFPVKFFIHRKPLGFEARCIDAVMGLGLKYLATRDAAELLIRHVQIEPLLYRFFLRHADEDGRAVVTPGRLNGVDGDFNVDSVDTILHHNMTVGHDELSYEMVDRFDKRAFLANLETIRKEKPEDHGELSKGVLEANERHSLQLFGCTNIVILIVFAITLFADFRTAVKALNSFDSDSVVLWCMKHIYAHNPQVLIDLDFYMQEGANRNHYNASAFFSDPSQYLYYHVCFDEFVYQTLMTVPPCPAT